MEDESDKKSEPISLPKNSQEARDQAQAFINHILIESDYGIKNSPTKERDVGEIQVNPYSRIERILTEKDMDHPAIKKLILAENDRLSQNIAELEGMKSDYFKVKTEKAILEEKMSKENAFDFLFTMCIAVGSGLVSIAGVLWAEKGWVFLLSGIVTIGTGVASKFIKRKGK